MGHVPVLGNGATATPGGVRRWWAGATAALAALAALFACDAPPVRPPDGGSLPAGIIQGTVTVTGIGDLRGDVYVVLIPQGGTPGSCPAVGTSLASPLNLIRIDRFVLFQDPGGDTHSADFTIPEVPAGCYSLVALLDADGDFNPLFGITSGATFGDGLGGAFIEPIPAPPASPQLRVLEVAEVGELVEAVLGVQVLVGSVTPFERPSFSMEAASPCDALELSVAAPVCDVATMAPVSVTLSAAGLERDPWIRTVEPDDPAHPGPSFPIILGPDLDMPPDFIPDDLDGDGFPDVYGVTAILRRLDDEAPDPATNIALDEDFPLVIPTVVDPTPFVALHAIMGMPPDGTFLFPADEITLYVLPVGFLPSSDGSAPEIRLLAEWLADSEAAGNPAVSPLGRYALTVIVQATNQTWTVPNELLLLLGDTSQGTAFEVIP